LFVFIPALVSHFSSNFLPFIWHLQGIRSPNVKPFVWCSVCPLSRWIYSDGWLQV
jgi:hypothetical protein